MMASLIAKYIAYNLLLIALAKSIEILKYTLIPNQHHRIVIVIVNTSFISIMTSVLHGRYLCWFAGFPDQPLFIAIVNVIIIINIVIFIATITININILFMMINWSCLSMFRFPRSALIPSHSHGLSSGHVCLGFYHRFFVMIMVMTAMMMINNPFLDGRSTMVFFCWSSKSPYCLVMNKTWEMRDG